MVFVSVGEDDGANVLAILFEVGDIRDHEVDAEEFGFGEHHACVDDDDVVTETKDHHVHSKFAETAKGDGREGLRRLTQKCLSPTCARKLYARYAFESYHRGAL